MFGDSFLFYSITFLTSRIPLDFFYECDITVLEEIHVSSILYEPYIIGASLVDKYKKEWLRIFYCHFKITINQVVPTKDIFTIMKKEGFLERESECYLNQHLEIGFQTVAHVSFVKGVQDKRFGELEDDFFYTHFYPKTLYTKNNIESIDEINLDFFS